MAGFGTGCGTVVSVGKPLVKAGVAGTTLTARGGIEAGRLVGKGVGLLASPLVPGVRVQSEEVGFASWYGPGYHGKPTASGEIYNQYKMTAAHRTFAFDSRVKVKNLSNGREVTVRINDRGPFVRGRIIDLSYEAARRLRMVEKGVERVRMRLLR